MTLVGSLGTLAAVFTTGAFLPQILKIRKQGGADLSYSMLAFYLAGVVLWLLYGLLFPAPEVVWANSMACLLVSIALVLKITFRNDSRIEAGRRLRIAVDMDEVIADSLSHHLAVYNAASGRNVTAGEILEKGLIDAIGRENMKHFYEIPHQAGFFADLAVIQGSQHALELLSSRFDVFITSAAMEVPFCFDDKFRWLQKHFPFIPTERIVFCGDKEIVNAEYLVDDRARHFARFRGTGILFAAPHNARQEVRIRANSWDDVLKILGVDQPVEKNAPEAETRPRALAVSAVVRRGSTET
jgi:5'-nucleotidase